MVEETGAEAAPIADLEADRLVGRLYAEYVASQPQLAPHGAPLPEGVDDSGVKLWRALAESEEATWAILDAAVDEPRALELTTEMFS